MQANLWSPGDPVGSSEAPLFFRSTDEPAALASIQSSGYLPPAYSVTPNGEALIDFIGPYAHWVRHRNVRAILQADYSTSVAPVSQILELCYRICCGFSDFAADQAISSCTDLASLLAVLPSSKNALIPQKLELANNLLLDFAVECLKPMECGTPFVHLGTSEQHKSWWKSQPAHLNILKRMKRRLSVDFTGHPSALQPLDQWLDQVISQVDRMSARPPLPAQRRDAILEASAYCGAIADRHLMRCHYSQAILHLHRSLDLMLFAVCDGRTLIDHSQHGGKYHSSFAPTVGANRITLLNSFDALKSSLAHNATRESDFRDLNDWRNLLIHTHYMSGLDDTKARELFWRIRPHLLALGGSQWQHAHNLYLRGVQLTIADLLDVDGSLSSSIQQITY